MDNLERLRILTERLEVEPHTEAIIERILGTCVPGKALVDNKSRFVYFNNYFRDAVGYSAKEMNEITLATIVPDPGHGKKVSDWFGSPRILLLRRVQVIHKTDGLIDVAVGIVPQNDVAAVGLVKI
jgi:PAS domain-containing protein